MPANRTWPMLALALSLGAVGCGAGFNSAGNAAISITAPADHVTTASKLKFSGQPGADIAWSASGGDDETGPGAIDANGLYTPPAYLTAATVKVEITAALASDPTQHASETITVTPAISIQPQNIALTPGSQTRLYAGIAQLGAGAVHWTAAAGHFSASHCQTSRNAFTQCTVTYTAPSATAASELTLNASLRAYPATQASARLLLNGSASTSPLENEILQTGADVLGTSGGNAHDSANQYCCGGTLGALVELDGQRYVLSNNHVLARTDQAQPGEDILQPGLLDTDCGYAPAYTVANLSAFPRLQDSTTNVDAALAQASSGALDPAGQILGFGAASANGTLGNAPPARDAEDITRAGARLPEVVKSGRTTGLTCSGISHLAVDLTVNYNTACDGSGDAFQKTFTNQIAIAGAAFADSGDSGALLADQQTAQPVGLIFSGNAEETFANPINDVLREVARAVDKNLPGADASIIGGDQHPVTCLQYDAKPTTPIAAVPRAAMIAAEETVSRLRAELMAAHPEILEVAAGASMDAPGEPAAVLYVDASRPLPIIAPVLDGLRTVIVPANAAELANGRAPAVTTPSSDLSVLPRPILDAAIEVKQRLSAGLRQDPAIFGVGVGKSMDAPTEAAITIFVQRGQTPRSMPATLSGVRVQYLFQDAPRAFNWKHEANPMAHASCSLRKTNPPLF